VVWDTANRCRPFCSERCRLIDLGAWADETYRIAGKEKHPPGENEEDTGPERIN